MGTGDWGKGRPAPRGKLGGPCSVQLGIMLFAMIVLVVALCQLSTG